MNVLTIIVNVLFILAVILLGVNIDFSVNSKNAIKNGLTDMAENLKIQTGAKSIDVNVYSGDNYFEINPSDSAYHAYLTINVDNVKQKTENEWLAVLMNGEKYAYKDYGYGNDDYALYTRTLTVPYLIREVPVFVTITDGYKSYCLYNNYSYDSEPKMVNADIYSELHPLTDNKTINTLISIVVILCIALGGLVYRLINRKKRIKEAGIKYYETVRKEGISDVKTNSAMAIQVGQKIADDIKIRNFKESFEELYKIGKAIYKKRVMAAGTTGEEQGNSALDNILQEVDAAVGAEKIEKDKKSKVIIAGILAGTVTIVVVAAVIVVKMVVIPANTYNKAMALREAGNDEEAYDILNELGDFKDSREICNEYDYNDALDFLKAGNYGKAYLMLKNLSGYSDADTAAEGIIEEHPQVKILTAQAGDEVILGSYEQDNNTSNGAEPIKWTVLYDADTISDINFIKEYDKPVIVVFGADYCPICVNYKPYIKEVNQIYGDEITVKYVDTSVHEDIRKEYNIELIPSTLFFYADGSAYVPTNEIDVDENEEEVNERKYISDKYTIVEGSYFPMAINYKFEYAIDSDGELAYCKYIGLLDMLQLDQIAKDLLKKQHLNLTK